MICQKSSIPSYLKHCQMRLDSVAKQIIVVAGESRKVVDQDVYAMDVLMYKKMNNYLMTRISVMSVELMTM